MKQLKILMKSILLLIYYFSYKDNLIVESEDATLSFLPIKESEEVLGADVKAVLEKNGINHEKKKRRSMSITMSFQVQMEELIYIKRLGSGKFGDVFLTFHKPNNKFYAMKSCRKVQIQKDNLRKFVMEEKKVLEELDHTFTMKYYRTFKDQKHLYFLLEYVNGIELFDVCREVGIFETKAAQLYTATIVLCLEYLHEKMIVYRDLKPENIVVDEKVSI